VAILLAVGAASARPESTGMPTARPAVAGRFVPPDGKLLLFVGQDTETLDAYADSVPEDEVEGVTLYTTLKSGDASKALPAMFARANWNAGDVDFAHTLARFPNAALSIGLAFDACKQPDHPGRIASGSYDASVGRLVEYLGSLAPRKVFLRIGYEFDGPWNCYTPNSYKAAFRRIAERIAAAGIGNVATVWQSAAWPDPSIAGPDLGRYDMRRPGNLARWYPGDDVVDWVGVSVFYRDLSQWNQVPPDRPEHAQSRVLDFSRARGKPVMIAEAAPQAYRIGSLTRSYIHRNLQTPISAEELWQAWFAPFFAFIAENRDVIRAVAYINTNWDTQGMWHCDPVVPAGQPGCANGNWGDSRVQANPLIRQRWLREVTDPSTWIQRSDY
jgi:hypothetical protein